MPAVRYHVSLDDAELRAGFDAIRREFDVPDAHPENALAEATEVAARGPVLPPGADQPWIDERHRELVAIDPPGSRDLDQAFGAERREAGYRVHYAIADVAAFVSPGGALETETLTRGVTLYAPDRCTSLHPELIGEGAASLLPGVDRPAVLWTLDLDEGGVLEEARVRRAWVKVGEALTYREAQAQIDAGNREALSLLEEIGLLRAALERDRGAVSLALPAQEVQRDEHGHTHLVYDVALPVERWNSQVSLLTGMTAADMMIEAGVGLLRTLPPADPDIIAELRRTAVHLEVAWDEEETYADRVRTLDPSRPAEAALLMRSARGLRGAGYAAFLNRDEIPQHTSHSAIAADYTHVTAPLRRVCDRYANEVVLALSADRPPPDWSLAALPELPSIMGSSRQKERSLERAVIDYLETMMLAPCIGAEFDAVVLNHRRDAAVIQLRDPAVISELRPTRPLGEVLRVRLTDVDLSARRSLFEPVR